MKVLVKKVGKEPVVMETDFKYRCDCAKLLGENCIYEYVDFIPNKVGLMIDEEGVLKNLPVNFTLSPKNAPPQPIRGTVILFRYQWEDVTEKEIYDFELRDLTEEDIMYLHTTLFLLGRENNPVPQDDIMQVCGVGDVIETAIGQPDGIVFDITDEGAIARIYYKSPTEQELKNFSTDQPFEMRYICIDNVLMMLFKFGDNAWMDAPYHPILSFQLSRIPKIAEGLGLGLTVTLVDTVDGTVKSIRLIGLGHEFSCKLMKEVAELRSKPRTIQDLHESITSITMCYETQSLVYRSNESYKIEGK